MVQMSTEAEAQRLVEHLNGNIPQGLTDPIQVSLCLPSKSTAGKDGSKGSGKMAVRYAPYAAAGAKGNDGGLALYGVPGGYGGKGVLLNDDASNLYVKGLPTTADELYLYKLF